MRPRLYIDVDGVLVCKGTRSGTPELAAHAREFLVFALRNFDCYRLTTHCRGDTSTVLEYLRPIVSGVVLELMRAIKPTDFGELKTDALMGEFVWIEDQPTVRERLALEARGFSDRLIVADTSTRPGDLRRAKKQLTKWLHAAPELWRAEAPRFCVIV